MTVPHSKIMSDKSFLESTDLTTLLEELLRQLNQHKPDNPWEYAAEYFRKVERCMHIVGVDYMTVVSCRYNRRSFIYCCMEALKHFPVNERLSVHDFYCLLQMICPDIPLSLIQDSAMTGCNPVGDDPPKYLRHELCTSLFFRFIFTEWLIMLENLFFDGKARDSSVVVSLPRLKLKFEEWNNAMSASSSQPTLGTLNDVLNDLESKVIDTPSGRGVTFDTLISALLQNKGIQEETVSFKPILIRTSLNSRQERELNTES